jgi:hypothetical protein
MKLLYSYLKQTKMTFFKNKEQEDNTGPGWGAGTSESGEDIRKGRKRVKMVEYYVLMYENGKMRPVEIPLSKENDGGG